MATDKTGITYDPIFLKHTQPGHPENAYRLISIVDKLESSGLFSLLEKIPSRFASLKELCYCHSEEYIERVKVVCKNGGGFLDADTYVTEFSFDAAAIAAGSLLELAGKVCEGSVKNGYALLRPPGILHPLPMSLIVVSQIGQV